MDSEIIDKNHTEKSKLRCSLLANLQHMSTLWKIILFPSEQIHPLEPPVPL